MARLLTWNNRCCTILQGGRLSPIVRVIDGPCEWPKISMGFNYSCYFHPENTWTSGPGTRLITIVFAEPTLLEMMDQIVMVVSRSPKRWDRWHITPQLAVYTTYIPLPRDPITF